MVFPEVIHVRQQTGTRRLVIGCGTGRCGTVSLVKFLNCQAQVCMLHEGVVGDDEHHIVSWYGDDVHLWTWMTELEHLTGEAKWYGDVGPYFLPYVPEIIRHYPGSRVLCVERQRKDAVESLMRNNEEPEPLVPSLRRGVAKGSRVGFCISSLRRGR